MAVPAAVPVAELPAEELPELLQAVTTIAATAAPAAARDVFLARVNFIMLLYSEGGKVTSWRKYHIRINYDKDEPIRGRLVI
jgi:hypothetical protein